MSDAATIDVEAVRARVARGAKLLDEKRPEWAAASSPERLDFAACFRAARGRAEPTEAEYHQLADHGFAAGDPGDGQDSPEYAALADAWRAEIHARTAEGGSR